MDDPFTLAIFTSIKSLVISILVGLGFKKKQAPNIESLDDNDNDLKSWQERINKKLHEQKHLNNELFSDLDMIKEYSNITLQGLKCILDYLDRNTDEKEIEKAKCSIDKFLFKFFTNKNINEVASTPDLCKKCPERSGA